MTRVIESLRANGWQYRESTRTYPNCGPALAEFHKVLIDGIDVIISVHASADQFVVWCNAEHRSSGPYENSVATAQTLDQALLAAQAECFDWDNMPSV